MTNLALGKPASQSSTTLFSRGNTAEEDASGANNGDTTVEWGFHTDLEQDPWWEVDLERDAMLDKVVIHNRVDHAERLARFTLLASPDRAHWTPFFGKHDDVAFGAWGEPYTAMAPPNVVARFVRLRLDGVGCLHAREIEVHGEWVTDRASAVPPRMAGQIISLDGFRLLADPERYSPTMMAALASGHYEARERQVVRAVLEPGDRVLEAGTAVGAVTMGVAAIVGPAAVMTFDANPDIVPDAQANFARNAMAAINSRVGMLRNRRTIAQGPQQTAPFFIARDFWASRLNADANDPGIVRVAQVPIFCIEDEIAAHRANTLICDIEGGEVALLTDADLGPIRKIIMETHYWSAGRAATDAMIRSLIMRGFDIDLDYMSEHLVVLRRPLTDAEKSTATRDIAASSRPAAEG